MADSNSPFQHQPTTIGDAMAYEEILRASIIHVGEEYQSPPEIIWVDDSVIATLGNFSASTGKAKSRKTFNVSALVAASLSGNRILNYKAKLPEGKRKILYFDTEQSRFHCHNVMQRILRLAGLPDTEDCDNFIFVGLREYAPHVRLGAIQHALNTWKDYGLVIIDGLRDLMLDINDASESVGLINMMMNWSSVFNIHIHCVLHLNKIDDNIRGHIGTELANKAETVLVVNRSTVYADVSEVHPLNMRDKEFKPFAFIVNELGLPDVANGYSLKSGTKIQKRITAADLTEKQHEQALRVAFNGKSLISGYEQAVAALITGYASIGFNRKRTLMSKILASLIDKGLIKMNGNDYVLASAEATPSLFDKEENE
ncbi:AAA family ATPase [Bacteroides thetaiotaomicron]|jgi:hypothetical protein|uniref:AAA family ATPase n=2 Tax=Bacteroides thetaiotaomicron TaxID=818 RepID=UPI0034B4149B